MEKEFLEGSLTDLRPKFRECLSTLNYQEQDEVISLITPLLEKTKPPIEEGETRDPSLTQKNTYYKIHYSDFNALKEAVTVASGLTTLIAAAVTGFSLANLPFGLVGGLVVLLFEYRRKRFKLNAKQAYVLKTLRKAPMPGWSVNLLIINLPISPWLEQQEVESILNELKSIIKEDGKEDPLVAEKDGIWRAIDVSFT